MGLSSVAKLCYIFISLIVPDVTSYSTSSAGSLYTALTFGYNNLVRPSGTTDVTVSFRILSVNHLDVGSQTFSATGWLDVSWTDSRFSWTPSSYSNINEMYLDYTYCWDPKIIVDNTVNDATILADSALLFKIDYTGVVTWSPSGEFTVHCSMDVTFYPYDVQTCLLSVKSWSFPATAVSLASGGIDSNQYTENDEWEMTSSSVTSQNVSTNGVAYSNLQFKFKMTRRPATILMIIVTPLVLVSFLSLFVFMVPPESSAKLSIPLAVLIAEVVMLNILLEIIPISARSVPALGTYVLLLVIFNVCEIFMTIVVVKLYHNKDRNKPLTYTHERLAAVLSAITCYRQTENTPGSQSESPTNETVSTSIESPQANETPPEFKSSIKRRLSIKTISPDCSFATSSKEEFRRSRRSRAWAGSGSLCGSGVDRKYTWEQVSSAVDRICLLIFVLVRLILAIIFMTIISNGSS